MENTKQQNGLLNRNKGKIETNQAFDEKFAQIERETINSALAKQFPSWDLMPPANLVRRRGTKLL